MKQKAKVLDLCLWRPHKDMVRLARNCTRQPQEKTKKFLEGIKNPVKLRALMLEIQRDNNYYYMNLIDTEAYNRVSKYLSAKYA